MNLSFNLNFDIGGSELTGHYMSLVANEKDPDADLTVLLQRLESKLPDIYSIDEMNKMRLSERV